MQDIFDDVVYKTISGSRSYGLHTPDSDEDTLGVFVQPPEHMLGVSDNIITHYRGDGELDENYKTISDFIKHARNGSSFWVEPLFVREEERVTLHPIFEPFIEHRKIFLTQALIKKSLGFMDGMIKRSKNSVAIDIVGKKNVLSEEQEITLMKARQKNMYHSVRVGNMIVEMLETTELRVYRPEEREHLLGIKTGIISLEDAWDEAEQLIQKIKAKPEALALPEKADSEILSTFLVQGIVQYWNTKKWI